MRIVLDMVEVYGIQDERREQKKDGKRRKMIIIIIRYKVAQNDMYRILGIPDV